MIKPGIHTTLTMPEYCEAQAVNVGLLQTISERCPAAAFYESWLNPTRESEPGTRAMDRGTVVHALLLEGKAGERVVVIDPAKYPSKTTGAEPTGWTNKDIRAARDDAVAMGKIPMLKDAMAGCEAMAEAARAFIATLRQEEPAIYAAFQPGGGDSEVSLFWNEGATVCRIRPDRINAARSIIVDYKATEGTAEPNAWGRTQFIRMGYYMAAAFYRRGVRAVCGVEPDYVFLVQEASPPYLCSLVGVDQMAFALGAARVDYALTLWQKCARSGNWPAYPPRVAYPVMPDWEAARVEEVMHGKPYDPAAMWGERDAKPA